jgi:nitronate monooxygenase
MSGPLTELGLTNPVLAAPMAGGPTTSAMVVAAARAGSLGVLAGGYKSAQALADQIAEVRRETDVFGVNLFAPNPVPVDPEEYRAYASAIQHEGEPYGLDLAGTTPTEDDDQWLAKIDLLIAECVPVASFTFGIPSSEIIAALQGAGTLAVQTVTSSAEARAAVDAGADMIAVQGFQAGGHSGTLTPDRLPDAVALPELVRSVGSAVGRPLIAAGGVSTADEAAAALRAGAVAVAVGTILLLTDESGASAPYKEALAARRNHGTIRTRAFTGRPARAIPNRFTDAYDAIAPSGYPAIHHLTSPLRRAAAAAGDPELINIWAGTGHGEAQTGSTADALERLAQNI